MGTTRLLASGPGWSVCDIVCTAGPHDRPFEERYADACVAVVTEGTFQCRSARGAALLAPGSILLGNCGESFECGHEHGKGDRCLAFHFAPEHLERITAAVPGARQAIFSVPRLPALPRLMPLLALAEAARDDDDGPLFEELSLRLAGSVIVALADGRRPAPGPSRQDERRITAALRRIEAEADEKLTLGGLACEAAMSPFHFLRTFRRVVGMTPHQYLLRTRLHRAAVRLRCSSEPVSMIAFDTGFNDLSTFNRRFRRILGASPSAYRTGRRRLCPGAAAASPPSPWHG